MKLNRATLGKLDLSGNADVVIAGHPDRFPSLIADRCMAEARAELLQDLIAGLENDRPISAETITMPRRNGQGPRPARLAQTGIRALYRALASALDENLPSPSRGRDNSERYGQFEAELSANYAIYLDIAACYEYIDHEHLKKELVTRTMNFGVADGIATLLGELMGNPRGLPQMHWASDRLADSYLDVVVRRLAQGGFDCVRYVDDFKIPAQRWDQAHEIVEMVAEIARELGLALAGNKTRIKGRDTAKKHFRENSDVLKSYLKAAAEAEEAEMDALDDANQFLMMGPYGELLEPSFAEPVRGEPNRKPAEVLLREAVWLLFQDWHKQATSAAPETEQHSLGALQNVINWGCAIVAKDSQRLSDGVLAEWAFRDPSAFGPICRYILDRATNFLVVEDELHWKTLAGLIRVTRRSPWIRIWMLHTAAELANRLPFSDPPQRMLTWLDDQLMDSHEIVRSEAAWAAAQLKRLSTDQVSRLYREATPLTQASLAAAVARQGNIGKTVAQAICQDGPLNRKASEWAEK